MRHRTLIAAAFLAASPALAQEDAWDAYNAGRYDECAELFTQVAATLAGFRAGNAYYNAACCLALSGDGEAAMAMLQRAVDNGYDNYNNMSSDRDLAILRGDPRLDALLERIVPPPIVITDNVRHAAAEAEFVFEDAENFVRAMKLVAGGADLVTTLKTEYFARATPGLEQMVKKYPFAAEDLAEAIGRHPEEYARIAHNVSLIRSRVPEFREAYRRLEAIAPDTVFPPTYFLVDRYRGIGSGSPDGQLITIEKRTDESIAGLETLLVHELVHFQQLVGAGPDEFYAIFGPKKTLLALTIREGTAEFFAELATGRMTQDDAVEYCLANEAAIWERFQQQMHDSVTAGWMWSTPADPEVPRDLAYVFGSRIVKAYYDRAEDKQQAVREILAVVDYPAFLQKSGYPGP